MEDPHIHIIGLADSVKEARQLVVQELQPQVKVTMKVDVPWTCHSNIIGKGGGNIQSIVKRTGVSVHFPDGNKNSDVNKCNQVSINSRGFDLSGLESARASIRELTQLTFSFTLPATAHFITPNFNGPLLLQEIQNIYNVQAELVTAEHDTVIKGCVKGIEADAERVKEATYRMLQCICGPLAIHIPVQTNVEVSTQHHLFVLGKYSENLKRIMHATATKIAFPDPHNPNVCAIKKSTVTICGAIHNVYCALQYVIGSLPLVLMMELQPDYRLSQVEINQIKQALDLDISVKYKGTDGKRSVIIKTAERNAAMAYEAWRLLVKADAPVPKVKVPLTYFVPEPTYYGLSHFPLPQNILPSHSPIETKEREDLTFESSVFNNNIGEIEPLPMRKTEVFEESYLPFDVRNGGEAQDAFFMDVPDKRAPGIERKMKMLSLSDCDYFDKKSLAAKAMKEPVTEPRTPTSHWSGYGLSKSVPGFALNQTSKQKRPLSYMDMLPQSNISTYYGSLRTSQPFSNLQLETEVSAVLHSLRMSQYIDIFESQDIDMKIFLNLTDQDLKDLGIGVFGHRKKLLLAIKNILMETEKLKNS